MKFVERDENGKIISASAAVQRGKAEEELFDDDPELITFFAQFPAGFLDPPNPEELERERQEELRIAPEHERIRTNAALFNSMFSDLENSLGLFLNVLLNIPNSQIAYAIYFSPTSFEARCEIVQNVLWQLISENPLIKPLQISSDAVFRKIERARRIRNVIAHASPQTLQINGRKHARLLRRPLT